MQWRMIDILFAILGSAATISAIGLAIIDLLQGRSPLIQQRGVASPAETEESVKRSTHGEFFRGRNNLLKPATPGPPTSEQEFVGWPVLAESPEAAGSGRGGLFLRTGLIVGLVGVVSFWGYYFLGDFISKRRAAQKESAAKDQFVLSVQPEPRPAIVKPPAPSNLQKPLTSRGAETRGNLTVQVGAFKDQGEADARAASLNAATSGDFHVVQIDIPGKGLYYRVQQVEGFASREAALSYGNRLRARNLISDFFVTTR